jgi:hypothetical protein
LSTSDEYRIEILSTNSQSEDCPRESYIQSVINVAQRSEGETRWLVSFSVTRSISGRKSTSDDLGAIAPLM